jgi:hypothetical protein
VVDFWSPRGVSMLSRLALLMMLCVPAFAQKMHVKVVEHTIDGTPYTRVVPGIGLSNGNATANCGAYGSGANCSATSNGNSIYLPPQAVSGMMAHIQILLLLPDGRRVGVYCNDRVIMLGPRTRPCKNPLVDEFEADFSGKNVKLTWGVGLDGKEKESETYTVGPVYPAPTPAAKP